MVETRDMELALRKYTSDPETLAEFYEASEMYDAARGIRRQVVQTMVEEGKYADAVRYAKEHGAIPFWELREIRSKWCLAVLEKRPWEALSIAREAELKELAYKAAVRWSDDILKGSEASIDSLVDIVHKERSQETDFCRRAVRHVYDYYLKCRNISFLPPLVREFPAFFDEAESALALFLAAFREKQEEVKRAKHRKVAKLA